MELSGQLFLIGVGLVIAVLGVALVWPSVAFALLLSISLFKVSLRALAPALMENFTYNMTVAILALIAAVVYRMRQGYRLLPDLPKGLVACWFVILAMMWLRLGSSRDFDEGMRKALIFSIFGTTSYLAVATYLCSLKEVRRLLRVLFCLGAFSGAAMLIWGEGTQSYRGARQSFLGAYVETVASSCAFSALVLMGAWLWKRKLWYLILLIISMPLLIYTMVASGTRGAIVAAPIAAIALVWLYRRSISPQLVIGLPLAGLLVGAVLIRIINPDMLTRFAGSAMEDSANLRIDIAAATLRNFMANPLLGNGTGDTAFQISGTVGSRSYPHNPLTEVFNELGVVGGGAYLGLLLYGFRAGWRLNRREPASPEAKAVCAVMFCIFFYKALMAMKGSSYALVDQLYPLLAAAVLAEQYSRSENALAAPQLECQSST